MKKEKNERLTEKMADGTYSLPRTKSSQVIKQLEDVIQKLGRFEDFEDWIKERFVFYGKGLNYDGIRKWYIASFHFTPWEDDLQISFTDHNGLGISYSLNSYGILWSLREEDLKK